MRLIATLTLGILLVSGADAATVLKKPRGRSFQMRVGGFEVQPGQDLEVCEYRRLPNRKKMDISGFELRMPPGAHHFVVWLYSGCLTDDRAFPPGPVRSVGCTGLAPDDIFPVPLIPIQTPNSVFRFPKGVAFQIEPHDQVWLNPHLKNFAAEAMTPDIRFNFYAARKGTVKHHAHGLIIGNMFGINIPARGDQTLTAEWTAPGDLTFIQLATHQHQLGTYANLELVRAGGVPELIYENTSWEHPRDFRPDPPIRLAAGDKVRITCQWHNTRDHDIRFGPLTTDEMCFILGYYYREGKDDPISSPECISSPESSPECMPGARQALFCPFARAVTN